MKTIINQHKAGEKVNYLNAEINKEETEIIIKLGYYGKRFEGILKGVEE